MSRADERVQAQRPVSVSCESWADFIDLYTSDISHGGVFIESPTAPALYTKVVIKMQLPSEIAELSLVGEVVRVVAPERATSRGQKPGFGIRFGDLDDDTRQALAMLMQHAQGQTGPNEDDFRLDRVDEGEESKPEPIASGEEYQVIMELRDELARVKEQDEFDILELDLDATVREVRSAFFELTKQWHPDKFQRGSPAVKALATQVFIGIKNAYQQLSRPQVLEEHRQARTARLARAQAHARASAGVPASTERAPSRPPLGDRVTIKTERPPAPPPSRRAEHVELASPRRAEPPSRPQPTERAPSRPPPSTSSPPAETAQAQPAAPTSTSPDAPTQRPRTRKRRRPSLLAQKMMRRVFEQTAASSAGAPAPAAREKTPAPTTTPKSAAARKSRRRARDLDKNELEADARLSKAAAMMTQHRLADAVKLLEEALEFNPELTRAKVLLHLAKARAAAERGDREDAKADYAAVLHLDPDNADAKEEFAALASAPVEDKSKRLFSFIRARDD